MLYQKKFQLKKCFFNEIIPKVKRERERERERETGIFYRPQNVNTVLETFLKDLKLIGSKKLKFIFLKILISYPSK